jgi:NADP-dependent 3-hydroxy acid dehydrogenase YdfG
VDVTQSETMIDTNIHGIVSVTRAILPGMVARNRGHVVNIGSVAASYPYPGGNVYAGTKAFVHQFSLGLRADLLRTKVRVTCIEPGLCETEFSIVRFGGDAEKAKAVYAGMTPLTADDIAETVHWCVRQPPHVNVNLVEIMPVQQAWSPFAIDRSG